MPRNPFPTFYCIHEGTREHCLLVYVKTVPRCQWAPSIVFSVGVKAPNTPGHTLQVSINRNLASHSSTCMPGSWCGFHYGVPQWLEHQDHLHNLFHWLPAGSEILPLSMPYIVTLWKRNAKLPIVDQMSAYTPQLIDGLLWMSLSVIVALFVCFCGHYELSRTLMLPFLYYTYIIIMISEKKGHAL